MGLPPGIDHTLRRYPLTLAPVAACDVAAVISAHISGSTKGLSSCMSRAMKRSPFQSQKSTWGRASLRPGWLYCT